MIDPKENFIEEIDFQKHWLVLKRRSVPAIGVFSIFVTFASLYALSMKPVYEAQGSLLISTNTTSSLTGLGETIGRLESLAYTNNPLDTQAQIIASVPLMQQTITELDLKNAQGQPFKIRELTNKLKIEAAKRTDVLLISYADNNPALATKIVNKVIEVYIRNNIEANRAEAVSAGKFIMQELPENEKAVKKAESDLRKFKEQNKIISLSEEANKAVETIAELEDKISQAQAKFKDATGRWEKLRNQANIDSQQGVIFAELSKIPGTQKVLEQLQEAQSQLAVERSRYQAEHPVVINLEEKVVALNLLLSQRVEQVVGSNQQVKYKNFQIGELRQSLIADLARTETEAIGLDRQIVELSNKLSFYRQRANVLPKLEQSQGEYERRVKAAQITYESLLTKLQEIRVAENQNIGNARVISPALLPDNPAASRKKLIIGAGVVLGVMFGVIVAFALDLIDRSLKTVKEAREVFQYTLLGVIPALSRNSKNSSNLGAVDQLIPRVIGRDIPQFPVGDAYQMLQANLKFISSDKKLKAIAVTSSVAKEGKSEVSANLAVAMAQVGYRVLLIDADMRHPMQHHIWGTTNAVGLSNVLVDLLLLEQAIQSVMPNLYLISSGVVPPNPVALLDSNCMTALVDVCAEEYDFVIIDTPQLCGTADAAVLGNMVDGILMVVRPGVVDSPSANAAKEFLTQSGQNVLGMVINGVNVKLEPDSYFYYTRKQLEAGYGSRTVGERVAVSQGADSNV